MDEAGTAKPKALFVLSASYSGSTMLDYMLGTHAHGFSCGECYAVFRPWLPHHYEPECTCGERCGRWERWMQQDEYRLYRGILTHAADVTFIVDSSKRVDWALLQSAQNPGIEPHYIVIFKRIEAWLQSVARRRDTITTDDYCDVYESFFDSLPPDRTFAVNYERLLLDPAGVLKRIFERCGIVYQPGTERFWTKTHHAVFGNDAARLHLCARDSPEFAKVASRIRRAKGGDPAEIRWHRTLYRPADEPLTLPWYRRSFRLSRVTRRLQRVSIA